MIKTITFAILHFSVAFSVAYILTGSIGVSSAVALVEPIVNTVVFYFHEKTWNRYEKNKSKSKNCGCLCISAAKVSDGLLLG
nr:DUF2061 domain-containing protein [uncultured Neisseria sp.]